MLYVDESMYRDIRMLWQYAYMSSYKGDVAGGDSLGQGRESRVDDIEAMGDLIADRPQSA
jgi:hypothetical protein